MDQVSSTGNLSTLVHFFTREVVTIREKQTMMRNSVGETDWHIPCMPNMTEFHSTMHHGNVLRTSEPRAVTCPMCKKTLEHQRAMDHINAAEEKTKANS